MNVFINFKQGCVKAQQLMKDKFELSVGSCFGILKDILFKIMKNINDVL